MHLVLNARINRGINFVAAGAQFLIHLLAVGFRILKPLLLQQGCLYVVNHVLHKMRIGIQRIDRRFFEYIHLRFPGVKIALFQHFGRCARRGSKIFGAGNHDLIILFFADHARPIHTLRDDVHAVDELGQIGRVKLRGIGGCARVITRWVFRDCRKADHFPQIKLRKVLVKIILCRRFHAINGAAQRDCIEIGLQYFILGIVFFKLGGKIRLLKLAFIGLLVGQHGIFDELLRNGTGAFCFSVGNIGNECAQKTAIIHAVVLFKADILHGDDRILQVYRNFFQRSDIAVFKPRIGGQLRAVFIINP